VELFELKMEVTKNKKIINKRKKGDWLDKEEILSPVQAEFRYSTVDHIFILDILRSKYTRGNNGQLFVAFLDLKSALNSVNRRLLVESMLEISLPPCFVAIIADMYCRVKFLVKVMEKISRLVVSHVGVNNDLLYLLRFSSCLLMI